MRSKPDRVEQPERTAHYDCAMCIPEMLHNAIAVNIPLPPDQHHCSGDGLDRHQGRGVVGKYVILRGVNGAEFL